MIMSVLEGVEHDAWREPRGRGAHEWWYFDAIDENSRLALTIIFFRGIPFSGVRQKYADEPPDRFPAVAFSLYGPERTELYFVNLHDSVGIGSDRMSIAIGRNTARYRDGAYEIAIDDELLDERRIHASFTFRPRPRAVTAPLLLPDSSRTLGTTDDRHTWIVAASQCEVEGQVAVGGAQPVSVSGRGYHDHNVGFQGLQDEFRTWRWGRAHFSDHTFVYYQADGHSIFEHEIVDEETRRNVYLLRYPSRTRITTPRGTYRVEQSRIVDNGPFYLRFLSDITAPHGEQVRGFTEVLRPQALTWRWFWPLLDSRVRPPHSGDRVGRKITQWLIQRGF